MHPLSFHPFVKMNGLGNEIVILDLRRSTLELGGQEARAIGRGQTSHFDQLMVLQNPRHADTEAYMTIFNVDGSLAKACGNGTRCVAWTLLRDIDRTQLNLETAYGLLACTRLGKMDFSVDMGVPGLRWDEIPLRDAIADTREINFRSDDGSLWSPSAVSMGNPHIIFWVESLDVFDLQKIGPALECDPMFPDKANITLASVVSHAHLRLKVWERGAGETRACGTAACAALVAAVRKNMTSRKARVTLPGGDLLIEWRESDQHVIMSGPVEFEHEGFLAPTLFTEVAV